MINSQPSTRARPNGLWLTVVALVVLVAAIGWVRTDFFRSDSDIDPDFNSGARLSATFIPETELDRLIEVNEQQLAATETPSTYIVLGQLYLEKARVTGDLSRYVQAEAAFVKGIELRPSDPLPAIGLAQVDLALHRFTSALDRVDGLARLDAVAVAVDAQIALGRLDGAERSLDILAVGAETAGAILVRRAEIAWLRGQSNTAAELALSAVNPDEPVLARRSWYQAFAAQMAFHVGDLESALELSSLAVANDPSSIGAMAVLARASAASGDLRRAETLLIDATSPIPEPGMLDELGDIQTALGELENAAATYATIDVIATLGEAVGAYDRSVARSLADRGVEVRRALEIAMGELDVRRDALTLDTVAWASFRAGEVDQARAFADEALATGIQDAAVLFHAAEIYAASGDEVRALELVDAALAQNPNFDVLLAEDALALRERLSS